jgi:WD40 repeat protein
MRDNEFTKILGWPGYRVYRHEIDEAAKTLRLWVRRKRGNRKLICSGCGRKFSEAHDYNEREVRDLPWGEYRTTVIIEVYRVCCPNCGIRVDSIEKGENLETFLFDVRSGKRAESPQIDPHCNWSLSPDGLLRAIVVYGPNEETVRLRSTSTGKSRDLVVKGWSGLKNIDWSADGRSLLVSWHDFQRDTALLKVTLDGKAAVLLHSNNPEVFYAIPSPDRQLLAIAEAGSTQNAWQLENF